MGSKPKMPPPPPPPAPPPDEADAAPQAIIIAQRRGLAMNGYRKAFLSGPRGPGGPEWQAQEPVGAPRPAGSLLPRSAGTTGPAALPAPVPRVMPVTTTPPTTAEVVTDTRTGASGTTSGPRGSTPKPPVRR